MNVNTTSKRNSTEKEKETNVSDIWATLPQRECISCKRDTKRECVCVCVCVCERERQTDRQKEGRFSVKQVWSLWYHQSKDNRRWQGRHLPVNYLESKDPLEDVWEILNVCLRGFQRLLTAVVVVTNQQSHFVCCCKGKQRHCLLHFNIKQF